MVLYMAGIIRIGEDALETVASDSHFPQKGSFF